MCERSVAALESGKQRGGLRHCGPEVNIISQTRLQYHKGLASGGFPLTANNVSRGEAHRAAALVVAGRRDTQLRVPLPAS